MSEQTPTPQAPAASLPNGADPGAKKRALAARTLGEIFDRLPATAKLELKDSADGGISVAVELEGEFPGLAPGKRSHVLEALQFLVNKIVNKPGEERRWVSLGIGGHPEPRQPKQPREKAAPPAGQQVAKQDAVAAPAPAKGERPAKGGRGQQPGGRAAAPGRAVEADERTLDVAVDDALAQAAAELARKSASLGRYYGVVTLKPEDRSRILKAVDGIAAVKVSAEGEGRNRRVVFTPDKPVPLPKRTIPDYGEDEE